MNVAAKRPVVSGIFDEKGFVPSLVQMTGSPIAFGVPVRVSGEPVLHPPSQVRLGSLNQRVDMVGHPAIGEHDPATALDFLPKSVGKAFVVTIVVKQFSPAITASDDVVVGTCELDAWRPRHSDSRAVNVQNPKIISHLQAYLSPTPNTRPDPGKAQPRQSPRPDPGKATSRRFSGRRPTTRPLPERSPPPLRWNRWLSAVLRCRGPQSNSAQSVNRQCEVPPHKWANRENRKNTPVIRVSGSCAADIAGSCNQDQTSNANQRKQDYR